MLKQLLLLISNAMRSTPVHTPKKTPGGCIARCLFVNYHSTMALYIKMFKVKKNVF